MLFNSSILDVAVGLIFSFLALSLATGVVVEAISSALKWRATTLKQGICDLLNDPQFSGLARRLYAHAAVNPRGPGIANPERNQPAYIDPLQFANAIMDLTGITAAAAQPTADTAAAVQNMKAEVGKATDTQLNTLLSGIIERAGGDPTKIKVEIVAWFDNGMDRLSGVYKRWSQLVSVIVALMIAIALNIDAVRIEQTLWAQPAVMASIKTDHPPTTEEAIKIMNSTLPVGWPGGFLLASDGKVFTSVDWLDAAIGWALAALATLFGAPFWFDILKNAARLRGSGPSPADKVKSEDKTTIT